MKQEFEMTKEQLQAIYDISRNQMPVMFVGVWTGMESKQEQANLLWKKMGDDMGFVWDSVEGSSKGNRFFLATPKPKVIPKTRIEIEMDKYDTLEKIIAQLEKCDYEAEGGILKNNVAFLSLRRMAGMEWDDVKLKR